MGANWVAVRDAVIAGTLRATDKTAPEVAARFDALLQYVSLRLGRQLGTDVLPVLSRKEQAEPALRAQAVLDRMVGQAELAGAIRIPHTVAPIHVVADLRAGRVTVFVDVDAPREGRATTRVNWILRQLKHAPESTRIESFVANSRGGSAAELLSKIREDPSVLVIDPKKDIRAFRVALTAPMGIKRGRGRGAFIDSVVDLVDDFYGDVVQHLKAWAPTAPKLRELAPTPEEKPALSSTAVSSQDGPEFD